MSTRRDGEPDQGAAVGPVRRPDELPPVPGESVPVVAEFGGVRAGAGVAPDGVGGDGAGAGAGGDDPVKVVQGGGAGGGDGASGGVPPGEQLSVSGPISGGVRARDEPAAVSGGRDGWSRPKSRQDQRLPRGGQVGCARRGRRTVPLAPNSAKSAYL